MVMPIRIRIAPLQAYQADSLFDGARQGRGIATQSVLRVDRRAPLAQLEMQAEPVPALLDVRIVPGRAYEVPTDQAALFVIAREPGSSGPPLAVRRVLAPRLPLEIALTDADSMLPQRPLSAVSEVEIQARLSASGEPAAQPGDWQSAALRAALPHEGVIVLALDEQVP